ncbi:MAG: Endonuc Holl protein [Dehalococcoidia bacterium]|nr:Endonuc Holl protein [Dehalococcoidia bacterium]
MEIVLLIIILVLLVALVALLVRPQKAAAPEIAEMERKMLYALASQASIREIQDGLKDLPRELLQSITQSRAVVTGRLHELLSVLELSGYDRLFYFGSRPIDYIGIKYGEMVDFIEVKTGNRPRLTEDEKKLKDLIEAGKVNYVIVKQEKISIGEECALPADPDGSGR